MFKKLKELYYSKSFWKGFFNPFGFKKPKEYHYHLPNPEDTNFNIAKDWIKAFDKFHAEERQKGNIELFQSDAYQEFLEWKQYWIDRGEKKMKTMNWTKKDVKIVESILGVKSPSSGDSLVRLDMDVEQVQKLIDLGYCDPSETQNSSHEISEFVKFVDQYPEIKFMGYVVFPPRNDMRISIEGFEYRGKMSKKMIIDIARFAGWADEFEIEEKYVRAWWD